MATEREEVVDVVRRLVYRIEESRRTLHRNETYRDRCKRLQLGLAFSKPEDCDCGLDTLLAEARALTFPEGKEGD